MEGLDAAIVVGGPATVLVAADFAFEPVHEKSRQSTVYSPRPEKEKKGKKVTQRRRGHRDSQRGLERVRHRALEEGR